MNIKERLRPLFEKVLEIEYKSNVWIAKGKEKSRLGFLPDAVVAGGFAAGIIQNSLGPIMISLFVRIALIPIYLFIAWIWWKSGAWPRELEYQLKLNPYFRRLERGVKMTKHRHKKK